MSITSKVDWLSITFKGQPMAVAEQLPGIDRGIKPINTKGLSGYNNAIKYPSGAKIMWNSKREDMGIHVMLTGSTLTALWKYGITYRRLLNYIWAHGGNLTRIDLSIDIVGQAIDMEPLRLSVVNNTWTGRAQKAIFIQNETKGQSLYVGSPKSAKRLRCYDKAKEQKLSVDWTRLEVQMREDYAVRAQATFNADETMTVRGLTWNIADKMYHVDEPSWLAFSCESAEQLVAMTKPRTNTEKWINKQVMPALQNYLIDTMDYETLGYVRFLMDETEKKMNERIKNDNETSTKP